MSPLITPIERKRKIRIILLLIVSLLLFVISPSSQFSAHPVAFTQPSSLSSANWVIVKSPNSGPKGTANFLRSVSAVSDSNVWAVGGFTGADNGDNTRAEHWNGTSWSVVPTPNSGINGGYFESVFALSSNDVWAVGQSNTKGGTFSYRTLIEHFNGNAWSVVPGPNPPSNRGDFLYGVTAIAPNDAWAVGNYRNISSDGSTNLIFPLILHWNGVSWQKFTNGVPLRGGFFAIKSFSASDLWALGGGLALHYNGTAWSPRSPLTFLHESVDVSGVGGVSSNDLWAVGSYFVPPPPKQTAEQKTFAMHWNGASWSQFATPNVAKFQNELFSVVAVKSNDVWAVGLAVTKNNNAVHTLIEHWNGKSWSIVSSPNVPGATDDELFGVTLIAPASLWAVGFSSTPRAPPQPSSNPTSLILRITQG